MYILTQPNDIFTKPASLVSHIGDDERDLLLDLFDTAAELGVPILAATQIGVPRQVFVRMDKDNIPNFFFNPKITWTHPDKVSKEEKGLSYPRPMWKSRPKAIRLTYDILHRGGKERVSVLLMGTEARYTMQMVELLNGGVIE